MRNKMDFDFIPKKRKPNALKPPPPRPTTNTSKDDDESEDEEDETNLSSLSTVAAGGGGVKRRKNNPLQAKTISSIPQPLLQKRVHFQYQSSGKEVKVFADAATRSLEIDSEYDREVAQALVEKGLKDDPLLDKDNPTYQGQTGYRVYLPQRDTSQHNAGSTKFRSGPMRAPTNLRVTSRFDYQPDICKDYKETGFCGFGDSCKFLHDRGDYKAGWQLDQEWEEMQRNGGVVKEEESLEVTEREVDSELPFKCIICRLDFTRPVVTK